MSEKRNRNTGMKLNSSGQIKFLERGKLIRNTWAWVYGDECKFLWKHFNIQPRSPEDRIKIELIDYFPEGDREEDDA